MNVDMIKMKDACKVLNISHQAIRLALRGKRLKGHFIKGRWHFKHSELKEYEESKYSREWSRLPNGEKAYDNEKGRYSIKQLASLAGVPIQRVYYCFRNGFIDGYKNSGACVLTVTDLEKDVAMLKLKYQRSCTCSRDKQSQ